MEVIRIIHGMGSKGRNRCEHVECTKDKQEWLPLDNGQTSLEKTSQLKMTPHCEVCGVVKSLRIDKAKPIGFYTNILRDLKQYLDKEHKRTGGIIKRFTAVEMRLIIKKLRDLPDFEDDFVRNRRAQIRIFLKVVREYRPDVSEEQVLQYVEY